jgi:hypothetical protein
MHIDGACHCGLISFTAEVDPSNVSICHCSDCQTLSGSPFRASVPAPLDSLALVGEPKRYIKVADNGNRRAQVFCPECATPLFSMDADNATMLVIRLGCVRQRALLVPTWQIWKRSQQAWLGDIPAIPGDDVQRPRPAA